MEIHKHYLNILKTYVVHLNIVKGLSKNTLEAYNLDILDFLEYLTENNINDFYDVTYEILLEYFTQLRKKYLTNKSVARYISSLKGFFKYLNSNEYIKINPMMRFKAPKKETILPVFLSIEEINSILDLPDINDKLGLRDKAMLEFAYATGVRVSELVNMKKQDLFFNEGIVRVFGKGSKERIIPIGSHAIKWTEEYLLRSRILLFKEIKSADYLFLNLRGTKLTRMGFWKILKSYTKKAGITKEVHPHTIRHTFASHLIQGGADLRVIQELLGHNDISTTQIYTHIDKEHLISVHKLYHPRG